jgi:hypothetical protein
MSQPEPGTPDPADGLVPFRAAAAADYVSLRVPPLPGDLPGVDAEYEYRMVTIPRGTSRSEARRLLAEHAEYGRWELARVRLMMGGTRTVWLRRKIIRVVRTA